MNALRARVFGWLLLAGLCAAPVLGAGYRAGVARIVITPTAPTWAGGYGDRTHPVTETLQDLYAKALLLDDGEGGRVLILTTDLLGLPANIAEPVAAEIGRQCELPREGIVLTSSHTHCGPVLRKSLVDIYPMSAADREQVEKYSQWLQPRLVQVAVEASRHMQPVKLSQAIGRATFAVNRRENKEAQLPPPNQLKGPVDHDVPVLCVERANGSLMAALFGYACHNTTMNFYKWCGDYAGFAQTDLEAAHKGATAMFVAGCGADQNPLPRRKIELCEGYGRQLADAVERVLSGERKPIDGRILSTLERVDVPFAQMPTREDLIKRRDAGTQYEKALAQRLLADLDAGKSIPSSYPYTIQAVQLGDDLTMVVLAGEVVVDYSLRLKRELGRDRTWVIAYANDVFAYIPSRRVLAEGGYEGATSMAVYGLPTVWSPKIEELIVSGVHRVVERVRGHGAAVSQPAGRQ